MKSLPWRAIPAWLLAAFFLLGGTLNMFASPEILAVVLPDTERRISGRLPAVLLVVVMFTADAGLVRN